MEVEQIFHGLQQIVVIDKHSHSISLVTPQQSVLIYEPKNNIFFFF